MPGMRFFRCHVTEEGARARARLRARLSEQRLLPQIQASSANSLLHAKHHPMVEMYDL